jgi:hypothetical protein
MEVIAFYPVATQILQPADVAVFHTVKISWWRAMTEWFTNLAGEAFAPLLSEDIEPSAKLETIADGFRACELYLLNPNALDYSKCLGTSASGSALT